MKFVLSASVLLMFVTTSPQTNSWRGITPVHSTCEDVKKILKVDTCSLPISEYTIPDYRVKITFANDACTDSAESWRVPKGTVLSVVVSPLHAMTISQFGIDLAGFKKRAGEEIIGMEHYDFDEQGVSIELFKGYVLNVSFGPRDSDDGSRCKSTIQAEHAQTDPTCCDRGASDPIKRAWLKFTAGDRYRLATGNDMRWREQNARAFAYASSSLGYDRHEAGFHHLAAIVIDTQRNDPNRFSLLIFSAPRTDKGTYKPYWVLRNQDLSNSHLFEYLGMLDLVNENEQGSEAACQIQWDAKNGRYICRERDRSSSTVKDPQVESP